MNSGLLEVLLPFAFDYSHNPDNCVGIFWYQLGTGVCAYSVEADNHSHWNYFPEFSSLKDKSKLVRGRIAKKEGKFYLVVYTEMDFGVKFPGTLLMDIKYKVQCESGLVVDYVVDENGVLILEKARGNLTSSWK